MLKPEVEEFIRLLVREVRDAAICECDITLQPTAGGPIAKRWRDLAKQTPVEPVAQMLIPDIVDQTVWELLRALDHGIIRLSFTAANGKTVDLTKDGRGLLVGWYGGEARYQHTRERCIDDYAEFRKWPPPPLPEEARRILDRKDPPAGT